MAEAIGEGEHLKVVPLALLVFVLTGALAPLADPDLPTHLAVGRWIAQHGAVPTTEPLAWTRPGAPYFAYSWLPQLGMYGVMSWAGPLGLRLLYGTLLASSFGAVLYASRQMGLTSSAGLLTAALHMVVLSGVSSLIQTSPAGRTTPRALDAGTSGSWRPTSRT